MLYTISEHTLPATINTQVCHLDDNIVPSFLMALLFGAVGLVLVFATTDTDAHTG